MKRNKKGVRPGRQKRSNLRPRRLNPAMDISPVTLHDLAIDAAGMSFGMFCSGLLRDMLRGKAGFVAEPVIKSDPIW